MKDKKTKEAFIKYLQDPMTKDLRFWQALAAFSQKNIFFGDLFGGNFTDTFYVEADDERA
jgi:hypothetical protein